MKLLILGCGSLGTELGTRLALESSVSNIRGTRRSTSEFPSLKSVGIEPVELVFNDRDRLRDQVDWADRVVFSAAPGRSKDGANAYQRVYEEGLGNVLDFLRTDGSQSFYVITSSAVYGQDDGSWVSESSPTDPQAANGKLLVQAESQVFEKAEGSDLDFCLLRLAGLYNSSRGPAQVAHLQAGKERFDGSSWLNLVHQSDAVEVLAQLLLRGDSGIFNVSNGQPLTRQSFYDRILADRGLKPVVWGKSHSPHSSLGKKVSNQKVAELLSFRFRDFEFPEGS